MLVSTAISIYNFDIVVRSSPTHYSAKSTTSRMHCNRNAIIPSSSAYVHYNRSFDRIEYLIVRHLVCRRVITSDDRFLYWCLNLHREYIQTSFLSRSETDSNLTIQLHCVNAMETHNSKRFFFLNKFPSSLQRIRDR